VPTVGAVARAPRTRELPTYPHDGRERTIDLMDMASDHVEPCDTIRAVLLPDGRWHRVKRGTWRAHMYEEGDTHFSYVGVTDDGLATTGTVSGPMSSVLAVSDEA
jgi:hypothetical protein